MGDNLTTTNTRPRLLVVIWFMATYGLFLLWHPVPRTVVLAVDGIVTIGGLLVAAGWALGPPPWLWLRIRPRPQRPRTPQPTARWEPVLVALSALTSAVLVVLLVAVTSPDRVTGSEPPVYAGMLINYPLMLAGVLCLPRQQMSAAARVRVTLDSLLIVATLSAVSWYFVIGPQLLRAGQSVFTKVVNTAFPAGDLVLVVTMLGLWLATRDRHRPTPHQ